MERPAKRAKLLSDSEGSEDESIKRKVKGDQALLKINREYAQRFEHNKEREERQQLEEKLQDDDDSTDESEDDEADLITDALDNEIMSTLNAIKSKDPRVYDKTSKFYHDAETIQAKQPKDKPMTLSDYHRENLLNGYTGEEEDIPTYDQEQDSLRRDVVEKMHAMGDEDSDEDFTVKKKGAHVDIAPNRKITTVDVANADKDPETFLSNFMAAQAWRAEGRSHAFDSDDSEDEARADAFEEAYNLRFEDPAKANETLKSFARDTGKYTVRREEAGGRKRAREREKEQKMDAKKEREEERARLRKLKIDEAEKKLKAIKHAAGIKSKDVSVEQWRELLEGDFSDDAWDKEMATRFGEQYYADNPDEKPTKPTWNDDIDIDDLVPEFDAGVVELSDEDVKPKKEKKQDKREAKAQHRRDRRDIEELVDATLPVVAAQAGTFRYRETSPNSFGLNARDILFASDTQLNQFAGLKKLAAFRDEDRKLKDRKKLGKKARLREWRKEVFGTPAGVTDHDLEETKSDEKKSSKKRSKKSKSKE